MLSARFACRWLLPALLFILAGCSNGRGSLDEDGTPPPAQGSQDTFTIGGTVTGLAGGAVVLQNNGAGDVNVAGDGPFTFATRAASGTAYNVTVLTQPTTPAQVCTVTSGAGTVTNANVTGVTVTCASAPRYSVSGTVSGLSGTGLVLQNNQGDSLTVNANGPFMFATALNNASTYSVIVATQPSGQNCVVRNGNGTIASANVSNVEVACAANQFTLGGTVTGLGGTGLVLQLNDANDFTVVSNGTFAFPQALADGSAYTVRVRTQPSGPTQDCTIANGSGTVAGSNVANIAVTCVTSRFLIGGTVSGLAGTGLALRLNGANDLTIQSNGAFTFSQPILSGASYAVSVRANPTGPRQICTPGNASGTVGAGDVRTVTITCATETFGISVVVSGLLGSGLGLSLNGAPSVPISADGRFTFSTQVPDGGAYDVRVTGVVANPTQSCVPTANTGTVAGRDVTDVRVTCTTSAFTVGGSLSNLAGSGFQLSNNGAVMDVPAGATSFTFPSALPSGSTYNVAVVTQPAAPSQQCTVTNGTGVVGAENVTTVAISCQTIGFTIGGIVQGLRGTGLTLQNNGADNLEIAANGPFTFPRTLLPQQQYNIGILQQPTAPQQLCLINGGAGTVVDANITNVVITCFGGN